MSLLCSRVSKRLILHRFNAAPERAVRKVRWSSSAPSVAQRTDKPSTIQALKSAFQDALHRGDTKAAEACLLDYEANGFSISLGLWRELHARYCLQGDPDAAMRLLRRFLAYAETVRIPSGRSRAAFVPSRQVFNTQLRVFGQTGRFAEAFALFEELEELQVRYPEWDIAPSTTTLSTLSNPLKREFRILTRLLREASGKRADDVTRYRPTEHRLIYASISELKQALTQNYGYARVCCDLFMRLRVSVPTGSEPLSAEHYATFYELAFMTDQNIDLAIRVFEETQRRPQLPSPSAACYQSLAMIYAKHKSTHQAISAVMEWADKLPDDPPTQLAYSYLLTEAANRKQMDYAAEILREMQRRGVHGSQTTYNLLLKLLIANRDVRGSLDVFQQMKDNNLVPNATTYVSLLHLFVGVGDFAKVKQLIAEARAADVFQNNPVANTHFQSIVLKYYCNIDNMVSAKKIVDDSVIPTGVPAIDHGKLVIITQYLTTLLHKRKFAELLELAAQAKSRGHIPDALFLRTVLQAAGASRQFDKGFDLIDSAKSHSAFSDLQAYIIRFCGEYARLCIAGQVTPSAGRGYCEVLDSYSHISSKFTPVESEAALIEAYGKSMQPEKAFSLLETVIARGNSVRSLHMCAFANCVAYPFLSKSDNARAAAITMRLRTAFEPSTSPLSIAVAQVAQNDLVVLRADIARLKANGTFPTTYTLPDTYQVYSQYYLRSKNTKPWDKDVPY